MSVVGEHDGGTLLMVNSVSAGYGRGLAVRDVSVGVAVGHAVALVGPNGAGKSTLVNCICGLVRARTGSISFDGRQIQGASAHRIARRGVAQVPEGREIVAPLTVEENLLLGCQSLRLRRRERFERIDEVFGLFPHLRERRTQLGGTLSGGEQQMLAIGRALVRRPKLLILDEPSLGLAPRVIAQVYDRLRSLRGTDMSILLVEQNVDYALSMADQVYVMRNGQLSSGDSASEFRGQGSELSRSYFGV